MKRVVVILIISVIYYFTVFQWTYDFFKDYLLLFLFSNLIAFALIYQWFKGQLYQL